MNIKKISEKILENKPKNALVGFDGFIDELNYVVEKKIDDENFIKVKTIADFGKKISSAAGLSLNIEFRTFKKKLGGNGPIMASALLSQDVNVDYIGALGENSIDDIYKDFAHRCNHVFSLANPGHTDALEFEDGKLMLGKMSNLRKVNWNELMTKTSLENITSILKNTDLIAFTNWTMITKMDTFFEAFSDILKRINRSSYIFVDLADPSKRKNEDIKKALNQISKMQNPGRVILGMNANESKIIAKILNIETDDYLERVSDIREKLNIEFAVIHPREGAAISYDKKSFWVDGPFCEKPLYSTGAGDNFNAGFCSGLLSGLEPVDCLITGVYTSGYYVRKGISPNKKELLDFLIGYNDHK